MRRPPLSARGGTAIPAKPKSFIFTRLLARIGPGGGVEGPIRTKILVKYVDFGLAEIADPSPPRGGGKQNISQENKILAG